MGQRPATSGTRVLQVLSDTDVSQVNRSALELHEGLASSGRELRTVALAPGRTGELAEIVPAIAPGRRSLAALTAVRAEARWADLVLFRGTRALPPLVGLLRSLPPVLFWSAGDPLPERALLGLVRSTSVQVLVDDGGALGPELEQLLVGPVHVVRRSPNVSAVEFLGSLIDHATS